MRRLTSLAVLFGVVLFGSLSIGLATQGGVAQDDGDMAGHPLVGTWLIVDVGGLTNDPFTINQYFADGNVLFASVDGTTEHGVWEATGPTTADVTVVAFIRDPSAGHIGNSMLTGRIEVDASGNTFHGTASFELFGLDGTVLDGGSVEVIGTRVTLETKGMTAATPEA